MLYIKDMEMPPNCSSCGIWSLCWDERPWWSTRLEYCPLVEVAEQTELTEREGE